LGWLATALQVSEFVESPVDVCLMVVVVVVVVSDSQAEKS